MSNPSVSIIVPVYKTPITLLQRFLRSAIGQTLSDIQVVLVDDCSPDDCPRILDAAAADDDRVTVLHRSVNGRAGMARNDGLHSARGNYVFFADADDIMRPDMCETLVGLANKNNADVVACSWSIRDQDGHLTGRHYFLDRRYDLKSSWQKAKCYRSLNYALWNKLFRHEIVAPLRFEQFEANIGEDLLFNISALCRSCTMATTNYIGYDYTVHTESATGRASKGMPYLRTLVVAGDKIRQTLATADGSAVCRRYGDWLALKSYLTGCAWIGENTDPRERSVMWGYWRRHLREHLLLDLKSYRLLAVCFRLLSTVGGAGMVYRIAHNAMRIANPLCFVDKIEAQLATNALHPARMCPKDDS
jgi:glycosyltransferase involved in cell wall biosynthesis